MLLKWQNIYIRKAESMSEAKLLFEDEVRSRQLRDEAIIRRQNILGNGSIYNSLDVFERDDNKGNTMYTVIDGMMNQEQ